MEDITEFTKLHVFTSSIENGNLINAKVSILIESIAQSRKDRIVDEYLH